MGPRTSDEPTLDQARTLYILDVNPTLTGLVKMPGKSPIEKLTNAVIALEKGLETLHQDAQTCANELIREGDALGKQVSNDIDIILKQLLDEINRSVAEKRGMIEADFAARLERELDRVKELGEKNREKAIQAVLAEMRKIITGG